MRAAASRPSNNHPSSRNARRARRPAGYKASLDVAWPWPDDPSEYFSVCHPDEFDAAIEAAIIDGSISNWTWAMLVGKIPPPGHEHGGGIAKAVDPAFVW